MKRISIFALILSILLPTLSWAGECDNASDFTASSLAATTANETEEEPRYYLSISTIFQNEARWIKEWIEYHLMLGVDHFLLFDHYSDDEWESVLAPYIEEGIVEVVNWHCLPNSHFAAQVKCYRKALELLRNQTKWIAFIDPDEFLLPIQTDSLVDCLADYEEFAGVVVNWKTFGTSGVPWLEPDELLIERLTWSIEAGGFAAYEIKSIVQPRFTATCYGPHRFVFEEGHFAVDTGFNRSDKIADKPHYFTQNFLEDVLVLNHYRLRTMDWAYEVKVRRFAYWRGTSLEQQLENIKRIDGFCTREEDLRIQRFIPKLKQRMGL